MHIGSDKKIKRYVTTQELQGSWSYTISGAKQAFIIRGFRDKEGRLIFKFVKQFYPYEPVFSRCSIKKNRIQIQFKLIAYQDGSDSKRTLKFKLTRQNGILKGHLLQSWKKPENVTLKKYYDYQRTEAFEGTWSHAIDILGKKESHVLRGFRDDKGRLAFTFLKQFYSYEPVFTECSVDKNQIRIKFKLTSYINGHDSEYRLKYVLKETKGVLQGQLFQSWKEPKDVTLKRINTTADLLQN